MKTISILKIYGNKRHFDFVNHSREKITKEKSHAKTKKEATKETCEFNLQALKINEFQGSNENCNNLIFIMHACMSSLFAVFSKN